MPGLPFPISEFLAGNVADTSLLIRLFQQFDNPAQWPAPSDFQEAAYDGYAPQVAEMVNPTQAAGGGWTYWQTQPLLFATAPNNRTATIVLGWFATSLGGVYDGRVAAWGSFTDPVDMSNPQVFVNFTPTLAYNRLTTPSS